jgi:hypothetical protein
VQSYHVYYAVIAGVILHLIVSYYGKVQYSNEDIPTNI